MTSLEKILMSNDKCLKRVVNFVTKRYFPNTNLVELNQGKVNVNAFRDEIKSMVYIAGLNPVDNYDKTKSNSATWIYAHIKEMLKTTFANDFDIIKTHIDVKGKDYCKLKSIIELDGFVCSGKKYAIANVKTIKSINGFLRSIKSNTVFVMGNKISIQKIKTGNMRIYGITKVYHTLCQYNEEVSDKLYEDNDYSKNDLSNHRHKLSRFTPKNLRHILNLLTAIQAEVIIKKFGLFGNPALSFNQISQDMGYNSQSIYRIYDEAIDILKKSPAAKNYVKRQNRKHCQLPRPERRSLPRAKMMADAESDDAHGIINVRINDNIVVKNKSNVMVVVTAYGSEIITTETNDS